MSGRKINVLVVAVMLVVLGGFEARRPPDFFPSIQIPFEDCGSQFELLKLSLAACMSIPCDIEKGNFVTLSAEFDTSNSPLYDSVSAMSLEAFWISDGVTQQAIIDPAKCDKSSNCPYALSGSYGFSSDIYVSNNLQLNGLLHFRAKSSRGDILMCYKVEVRIQ